MLTLLMRGFVQVLSAQTAETIGKGGHHSDKCPVWVKLYEISDFIGAIILHCHKKIEP